MGCAIQFLCYFRFTFVDDLGFITQSGLPAGPKHFNNNHIFVDFCNFALLAARRPDPARKGSQGLAIGLRRSCARLGKTPNAWQKACVAASARVGTLSQNGYGAQRYLCCGNHLHDITLQSTNVAALLKQLLSVPPATHSTTSASMQTVATI